MLLSLSIFSPCRARSLPALRRMALISCEEGSVRTNTASQNFQDQMSQVELSIFQNANIYRSKTSCISVSSADVQLESSWKSARLRETGGRASPVTFSGFPTHAYMHAHADITSARLSGSYCMSPFARAMSLEHPPRSSFSTAVCSNPGFSLINFLDFID